MGPVAIGTENDDFDGEVYRTLLERILGEQITRWPTDMRFSGWQSIEKRLGPFLVAAAARGVRRALIAVDNDGGSDRHPEHEDAHDVVAQSGHRYGCCECWLRSIVPEVWRAGGGVECIVVPVQTIETWLLSLRGDPLSPSPEACHRAA